MPSWSTVPGLTVFEAWAIKAWKVGEATPEQQRRAFDCVMNKFCRANEASFVHDKDGGERASCFNEGRRFVGLSIQTVTNLPAEALRTTDDGPSERP